MTLLLLIMVPFAGESFLVADGQQWQRLLPQRSSAVHETNDGPETCALGMIRLNHDNTLSRNRIGLTEKCMV